MEKMGSPKRENRIDTMARQDACGGLVQEEHIRTVREDTLREGIQEGKSKTR